MYTEKCKALNTGARLWMTWSLGSLQETLLKRIAGYSLPRKITRFTPTRSRERQTRIGRQWVFPPNPKSAPKQVTSEYLTPYISMKIQTPGIGDDLVKNSDQTKTTRRIFSEKLGTRGAQLTIRLLSWLEPHHARFPVLGNIENKG